MINTNSVSILFSYLMLIFIKCQKINLNEYNKIFFKIQVIYLIIFAKDY
ncbi:hypothetical protein GMMP13_730011 [Candidatus Magnetomoraceae bacterium gMMP-13]